MKILYISSPAFADCDFPLIKSFQEKGYDVTYLLLLRPYSLRSTLFDINEQLKVNDIIPASSYKELKVYESYFDLQKVYISNRTSKKDSSFLSLMECMRIINFIKKEQFDIIHTDVILNMWYLLVYIIFNKKMILTVHDPFPHTGEATHKKIFARKQVMSKVNNFVLLNRNQKDDFIKYYELNKKNVFVNRLGIYDNVRFFVNKVNLERTHNVLFLGRISPYKGLDVLCRAMVLVRKNIPDATLTIAGGGKMYFDFSPYEKFHWIEKHNHFISMTDIAKYLQECTITVCPYIDATQSGVIMTSYGMEKPVIASNVGGLGEMVEDKKNGLLVSPGDVNELANSIITLLRDDDMRMHMREYIKNEYYEGEKSWNSIANKYIEFYRTVGVRQG